MLDDDLLDDGVGLPRQREAIKHCGARHQSSQARFHEEVVPDRADEGSGLNCGRSSLMGARISSI
jgi:hypothetical protein